MKKPNPLPPLKYLREHFNFSENGIMTLKKKAGKYDNRRPIGAILGSLDSDGYLVVGILDKVYRVSRLVFYNAHGWCPDIVDHQDQNKTNNHPNNLRPASCSQSTANRKKFATYRKKPTSSKKKGVSWHKGIGKYQARTRIDGKLIYLGFFDTEEEAHGAYCKAAAKLHGEYHTKK